MDGGTIGQLLTFATVVAGFIYQFVREGRAQARSDRRTVQLRAWALEDRALLGTAIAENTAITATAAKVVSGLPGATWDGTERRRGFAAGFRRLWTGPERRAATPAAAYAGPERRTPGPATPAADPGTP